MTPREKADALIASWRNGSRWTEEMSLEIERAITAAVEEEREACARICDKMFDAGKRPADDGQDRMGVPRNTQTGYTAREIARLIRARKEEAKKK